MYFLIKPIEIYHDIVKKKLKVKLNLKNNNAAYKVVYGIHIVYFKL